MQSIEPDDSYQITALYEVEGAVEPQALQQALDSLTERHELLSGAFTLQEETPVFDVQQGRKAVCTFWDMSQAADAEVDQRVEALLSQPLNLADGPLFRVHLLRCSAECHLLLLVFHRLIADERSVQFLVQELFALWHGEALPAADSFLEYAAAQKRRALDAGFKEALERAGQRLQGTLPVLQLPVDHPRKNKPSFQGASVPFALTAGEMDLLERFCAQEGVSVDAVLLAAFQTLLARHSRQDDLITGLLLDGVQGAVPHVFGPLRNTLLLRSQQEGAESFLQRVVKADALLTAAHADADLPFELLVETLPVERDISAPLYQAAFERVPVKTVLAGPELVLRPRKAPKPERVFCDLTLRVGAEGGGRTGSLLYNAERFTEQTAAGWAEKFTRLLVEGVQQPHRKTSEFAMVTTAEQELLLTAWQGEQQPYRRDLCLHEPFEAQAEARPEATALIVGTERLTYRELNERANRLARRLVQLGVGPEVLVGVCMERTAELPVAMLAVLKAGGAYVPLDPNYPKERIAFTLEDAKVKVLLTQERLLTLLSGFEMDVLCVDQALGLTEESAENLPRTARAGHLAYVIYTSGSTGKPKGVAIEHRSAAVFVQWAQDVFSAEELQGVLFSTSVCFDLSIFELFVTLAGGGKVILAENALYLAELPARNEVTLINTVPSAITELLQSEVIPSSVKTVNLAGEPLKNVLVQQLYRLPSVEKVYNLYGPSEDTTYSTYVLTEKGSVQEPKIGKPIACTEVYLLDEQGQLVPPGVPGELYIGGEGLARGYLGRPELTAEKFLPHPFAKGEGQRVYRTGDLARFLPDGTLEYLGRLDHQVKLRGFRIELGEIESLLTAHASVREALLLAREDLGGGQQLVAYVVGQEGAEVDAGVLRSSLQEHLPLYMIPSYFVVLERFPLTPNGKIDRFALPKPAPGEAAGTQAYVPPENEEEAQIAAIWAEVLGVERIGRRDNFFALGGHSLLSTQAVTRLKKAFGLDLPLLSIFWSPTIAELAVAMERLRSSHSQTGGAAAGPKLTARSKTRVKRSTVTTNL